jgi:hypothetical protein
MCPYHWKLVPKDLKKAVYRTYRPGQETDKRPSVEYIATALAAIFAVADTLGQSYDPHAAIRAAARGLNAIYSIEQINQMIEEARNENMQHGARSVKNAQS